MELPKQHEMPPKDKYTVFSRQAKGYRKGIHKVPKWTRVRVEGSCQKCFPLIYVAVDLEDKPQGFLILFRLAVIHCIIHTTIIEACCRPS